jgi:RNA polymerase sigma-70 factor, ECF subfamily
MGLRRSRDGRLVALARGGSSSAVEDLARRHLTRAFRAALAVSGSRELAEEAAQEAFLDALRSLDRFDQTREFGPWIARMAANRALQALRRDHGEASLDDVDVADPAATEKFMAAIGGGEMAERLAVLPAGQRAVLVLRYWLDLRPVDVAETLGVPVGTVHSREKRALDALRGQIGTTR